MSMKQGEGSGEWNGKKQKRQIMALIQARIAPHINQGCSGSLFCLIKLGSLFLRKNDNLYNRKPCIL